MLFGLWGRRGGRKSEKAKRRKGGGEIINHKSINKNLAKSIPKDFSCFHQIFLSDFELSIHNPNFRKRKFLLLLIIVVIVIERLVP